MIDAKAEQKGKNSSTISVEIPFSPEAFSTLERIADNLNVEKATALSKAMGLVSYGVEQVLNGKKLILEKDYKIFGVTLYTRRKEVLLEQYLFG